MNHSVTPSLILNIWPPFFEEVHSGKKTVEGRPFTPRYVNLKEGEFIQIVDKGCCKNFVVEITRLTKYNSFSEMLETEGIENCLPGIESLPKGVETYHSFPNYEAQEQQYGVIALGIKVFQASSAFALSHPASIEQNFANRSVVVATNISKLEKEKTTKTSLVDRVTQRQFATEQPHAKKNEEISLMNNLLTPKLTLSVRLPFFEQICSGQKTIEGRLFTSKYANLVKGDHLKIADTECANNFVYAEITRLTRYSSFLNMLEKEGLTNCLPGIRTLEEGLETYHSFPDYKSKELEYGVIAIAIQVHQKYYQVGMAQGDKAGLSKL